MYAVSGHEPMEASAEVRDPGDGLLNTLQHSKVLWDESHGHIQAIPAQLYHKLLVHLVSMEWIS